MISWKRDTQSSPASGEGNRDQDSIPHMVALVGEGRALSCITVSDYKCISIIMGMELPPPTPFLNWTPELRFLGGGDPLLEFKKQPRWSQLVWEKYPRRVLLKQTLKSSLGLNKKKTLLLLKRMLVEERNQQLGYTRIPLHKKQWRNDKTFA